MSAGSGRVIVTTGISSLAARLSLGSAVVVANGTSVDPFPFDVVDLDDWGNVANASMGTLTVPADGRYRVRYSIGVTSLSEPAAACGMEVVLRDAAGLTLVFGPTVWAPDTTGWTQIAKRLFSSSDVMADLTAGLIMHLDTYAHGNPAGTFSYAWSFAGSGAFATDGSDDPSYCWFEISQA
jgi:hypothetical protein